MRSFSTVPEVSPSRQADVHQHFHQTTNPGPRTPGHGERPFAVPVQEFQVERPNNGQAAQAPAQRYVARFFLFAFECAPELVDVELEAPATVPAALARGPGCKRGASTQQVPQGCARVPTACV